MSVKRRPDLYPKQPSQYGYASLTGDERLILKLLWKDRLSMNNAPPKELPDPKTPKKNVRNRREGAAAQHHRK